MLSNFKGMSLGNSLVIVLLNFEEIDRRELIEFLLPDLTMFGFCYFRAEFILSLENCNDVWV
jgi:hypothetical protein